MICGVKVAEMQGRYVYGAGGGVRQSKLWL